MSEIRANTVSDAAGTGPVTLTKQSAAKAWANLNGTGTIALNDSLNISSVADVGVGQYEFSNTTAFASVTSYTTMVTAANTTAFAGGNTSLSFKTASLNRIYSWVTSLTLADAAEVGIASQGDLA